MKRLYCTKTDDYGSFGSSTWSPSINLDGGPDVPPVFACKFSNAPGYRHILALANEEGQIAIHNTIVRSATSETPNRFSIRGHYNAVFDLAWLHEETKLVSVSGDHTARLYSITPVSIVEERIFHGHTRSVKTVAARREDPAVFATGARDGAIFVWDRRANLSQYYVRVPDRVISAPHRAPDPTPQVRFRKRRNNGAGPVIMPSATSVTALAFQDEYTLISSGSGDGSIKLWDLRYFCSNRDPHPKYTIPYSGCSARNGFSNLLVDKSGQKLYASCMDNVIYCYKLSTYSPQPIMRYTGHQNSTFYVKSSLSPDSQYIVSGSGDNNAYIWNINSSQPLVRLEGHQAEVTCVDWCNLPDVTLVTCSDDLRHKLWRVRDLNPDISEEETKVWRSESRGFGNEIVNKSQNLTPTGYKRRASELSTPHSQKKRAVTCERCQMLTPGSEESYRVNCENCMFVARSSGKRNASQSDLEPDAKRLQTNGPRRLFATNTKPDNGVLATILEDNSPDENFSPTANLPNFVVDGTAPHLKNFSPQKKRDCDWLTKIRIEQSLRNRMDELSQPSSPKQPRLSSKTSSTSRRKSTDVSATQSPLLKYFQTVNGKSIGRASTSSRKQLPLLDNSTDVN